MTVGRTVGVFASAAILRSLLTFGTSLPASLQNRNELSTPITSWERLKEGYYLINVLEQDPYRGGSFHQAPLLLLLGPLLSPIASHLVWTACELATAYLLGRIAAKRRRKLLEGEREVVWSDWKVAALYLFHPFSIATSLARSTIVFSNLFVALAVYSAVDGSYLSFAYALSLATHLSLYPILLLPPLILVALQASSIQVPSKTLSESLSIILAFVSHQFLILHATRYMLGSWNYVKSVYGVILTIPDLTPTIGLGWYFFIEMFDHFRSFFVGVFQLHVLIYVAPLTIAFRKDPLFAVVLLTGVIAIFKSYPSLGDFALWHGLLASYSELNPHLSNPFLLFCLTLYSLFLLPSFHYLWLYSSSGNSNFFYASTLVWSLSQGGLLIDVLKTYLRREVLEDLGVEGREKVKEEKWVLVQK